MKSLFVKALMPVAAFMLASAGAISTSTSDATPQATVQGWKRISAFNCTATKVCNQIGTAICVNGVDQMYGKATPTSDCTQLLTHRP